MQNEQDKNIHRHQCTHLGLPFPQNARKGSQGNASQQGIGLLLCTPSKAQPLRRKLLIATLQKKKISQQAIIEEINRIKQKMTVVDFSLNDITTGIDNYTAYRQTKDLEDNIQFCMSLKMKCHYFVTDNIKDYKDFTNISILAMKDYRTVEL